MKLRTNLFITFSLLLFVTAGCGKNGLDRAVVYGTVTYDGKEVGDGDITFFPKPGTKGSGGGGRIIRGKYRFSEGGGVPLGEYKVIIDAYELAPGADPPPPVIGLDDSRGKR